MRWEEGWEVGDRGEQTMTEKDMIRREARGRQGGQSFGAWAPESACPFLAVSFGAYHTGPLLGLSFHICKMRIVSTPCVVVWIE